MNTPRHFLLTPARRRQSFKGEKYCSGIGCYWVAWRPKEKKLELEEMQTAAHESPSICMKMDVRKIAYKRV
jgi:hypothetical protein